MRWYLINYTIVLQLNCCSLAHLRKISQSFKKFQNFAARIIINTRKFDHITPVLQELAPSYLNDHFVTRYIVHDRNTRNKDYLNIPAYQSAAGQRIFLYRAIKLWNSLPRAITAADSLPTFEKKLREFLF